MDVTRRCDYACRILRAAFQSGEQYVSVSEISEKEDIPYAFARSIQHDLVKGGLIKTVRGARGGLVLNCDPHKVTLLDVLEAVQGPVSVALCSVDPEYCEKQGGCAYDRVWQGADKLLNDYFAAFTLADILTLGDEHPKVIEVLGPDAQYDKWMCAGRVKPADAEAGAPESADRVEAV